MQPITWAIKTAGRAPAQILLSRRRTSEAAPKPLTRQTQTDSLAGCSMCASQAGLITLSRGCAKSANHRYVTIQTRSAHQNIFRLKHGSKFFSLGRNSKCQILLPLHSLVFSHLNMSRPPTNRSSGSDAAANCELWSCPALPARLTARPKAVRTQLINIAKTCQITCCLDRKGKPSHPIPASVQNLGPPARKLTTIIRVPPLVTAVLPE